MHCSWPPCTKSCGMCIMWAHWSATKSMAGGKTLSWYMHSKLLHKFSCVTTQAALSLSAFSQSYLALSLQTAHPCTSASAAALSKLAPWTRARHLHASKASKGKA